MGESVKTCRLAKQSAEKKREPVSNKVKGEDWYNTWGCPLASVHCGMHVLTFRFTYTWTHRSYKQTHIQIIMKFAKVDVMQNTWKKLIVADWRRQSLWKFEFTQLLILHMLKDHGGRGSGKIRRIKGDGWLQWDSTACVGRCYRITVAVTQYLSKIGEWGQVTFLAEEDWQLMTAGKESACFLQEHGSWKANHDLVIALHSCTYKQY